MYLVFLYITWHKSTPNLLYDIIRNIALKYQKGENTVGVDKKILEQYVDACEMIRETEQDIKRLKRKRQTIVTGSVKGSMNDFPYAETHFKIEGTSFTYTDDAQLRIEEKLLGERKAQAEEIKVQVEQWMNSIPVRMQRIIRYKFFEGMSWERVADRIGRKATGDSIRMEFNNFMRVA